MPSPYVGAFLASNVVAPDPAVAAGELSVA
jgi:hypothetical protein